MNFGQKLERIAESYAEKGYKAAIRPGPEELPNFAKGFKVELVAVRGSEGVIVSVKRNREEMASDPNLPQYAELANANAGWRFDFFILEGESPLGPKARDSSEFSPDDINKTRAEAEQLVQMGYPRPAMLSAWAAFEAAMRLRLRAAGEKVGWGDSPRGMINELYSSGMLSPPEFRLAEKLSQVRNQIVHGYSSPNADPSAVKSLSDLTDRLLNESLIAM